MNAFVLGLYLSVSSIVFYYLISDTLWFSDTFGVTRILYNADNPIDPTSQMLNGVMYLQVSITGQLVIFCTRTRSWFWSTRPSWFMLVAFVVAQLTATFIAVYAVWPFTQLSPIGWNWAGIVWVWSLVWSLPLDVPKILLRRVLEDGWWNFHMGSFEAAHRHMVSRRGTPHEQESSRRRGLEHRPSSRSLALRRSKQSLSEL